MEKEYHDPLPPDDAKTPEQAIRKIRFADREHLYVFRRGKQFRRYIGDLNRVTPPPEYHFEMEDAEIVHNHPGGNAFSREDMEAIVEVNANKLIVVTENYIYEIERPGDTWPIDFETEYTQQQWEECETLAENMLMKMISNNEITLYESSGEKMHYI